MLRVQYDAFPLCTLTANGQGPPPPAQPRTMPALLQGPMARNPRRAPTRPASHHDGSIAGAHGPQSAQSVPRSQNTRDAGVEACRGGRNDAHDHHRHSMGKEGIPSPAAFRGVTACIQY